MRNFNGKRKKKYTRKVTKPEEGVLSELPSEIIQFPFKEIPRSTPYRVGVANVITFRPLSFFSLFAITGKSWLSSLICCVHLGNLIFNIENFFYSQITSIEIQFSYVKSLKLSFFFVESGEIERFKVDL